MSGNSKKKVLLYYRYFGRTHGGGDYLPLSFVAELQKSCYVTLALDWTKYFRQAVEFFGIPIDTSRLKLVMLMPEDYNPTKHGASFSLFRFRKLKKLAEDADICIACDNLMDFGRPAHHFLTSAAFGDAGFADYVKTRRIPASVPPSRRLRDLADRCLRRVLGMRTRREIICNPQEHIYPNSNYIASLLVEYYGGFNGSVFYPPTIFDIADDSVEKDPLKVVYIGRLIADKRIADIISIVERARELSGKNITLSLAGRMWSEEYRGKLEKLTSGMDWVEFPGELHGEEKTKFLLSASYAVHAMREEAFGISITEYLKAGIIPVVPDSGGACEVADNPELSFRNNMDAAEILAKLLDDSEFRERQRRRCAERAGLFSRESYMRRQHKILKEIVES